MGRIGQCVAKKAIYGFDMNVLGYDPYVKADALDEKIVLKSTLEDVLNDSDYVTIHVPLTNETKGMFNKSAFASMKKGSILINTSRGEIINESDLLYALKHGQIAGGAFDLLCQEPPPIDHPLFEFQNVILTPHNAAHTYEAFENMALHAVQGVHEVLSGQMPTWPVMV